MPEFAKTYDFSDQMKQPMVDGRDFPWYIAIDGPLVQEHTPGATHILWVPIIVDASMPTPPEGTPDGEPLSKEHS